MNLSTVNEVIIELGERLKLIKQKEQIKICNFANNYYGDQHCCDIKQIRLQQAKS